jgi:hypothetical protein
MNKTERLARQAYRDSTVYVELCGDGRFTTLEDMVWVLVDRAMVVAQGDVTKAAMLLGVEELELHTYLQEKEVGPENYRGTDVEREHDSLKRLPLEEDERTC